MKTIYLILLITITNFSFAQKAEQIQSIADAMRDSSYYASQSKLWKIQTTKNKKNVNAWFNYFRAMRYKSFYDKSNFHEDGKEILAEMKKASGDSYEYNYLMYLQGGNNINDYGKYILKAYKMSLKRTLIYPSLVSYCDLIDDNKLRAEVLKKWFNSGTYPNWKYSRSYNALIGLDDNAYIFSNGDNDVYGKLLLQENKNLRTDVNLIILPYMFVDDYYYRLLKNLNIEVEPKTIQQFANENKEIKGQNLMNEFQIYRINTIIRNKRESAFYFDSGMQNFLHENYKDSLYLEGIVYKYSDKEYNNIAVMQRNFEHKYLFDYIKINFNNADKYSAQLHATGSYLTFLTELYDSYKLSQDLNNIEKCKHLLTIIGGNIGMGKELLEYIND